MIQFNLLPDVKLEFIKTQRAQRTIMMVTILISGALLTVLILLFLGVNILQKGHLNDLSRDIDKSSQRLEKTDDLDKILTIQNQLASLSGLHDQKPVAKRVFEYLSNVTPNDITIARANLNFGEFTIELTGTATDLGLVNTYVDTLKFSTFETADDVGNSRNAFTDVVLSNFARGDEGATYEIILTFAEAIFSSSSKVTLTVPNTITTRSETEKPASLFKEQPVDSNTEEGA